MGESSSQIVEGPQPKPSRFQFVPVPGEFTRGRWKCRDSYHPYAETLEFEKNKTKETNPDKISVFFKLRQPEEEESTIQVTSIKNKEPDNGDEVSNSTEKNYDQIRELSVDDFENKTDGSVQQVPPTPMNTPPASMIVVDTSIPSASDGALSAHPSRKTSNEDNTEVQKLTGSSIVSDGSSSRQPLEPNKTARHFQVEPVVLSEPSTPSPVAPAPSIETLAPSPAIQPLNEPTFQVIQTEESKNMSMDSVKNVIDAALAPPITDRLNLLDEVETPTNVMITVSAALEKKDVAAAGSVGSLDACGIPIPGPQIVAPHSTPYGTPKDTQNVTVFEEVFSISSIAPPPTIITTTTAPASSPVSSSVSASASASLPSVAMTVVTVNPTTLSTPSAAETHTPIDNKIEQAMELVKTHLTYAVREEVDTLRNTIADLEYQMRESQYECNYYRQHCTPELVEQASTFVHQQMAGHQRPTRRVVSTTNVIFDGVSAQNSSASASASSAHMRNLQNQIQQMKQIAPVATITATNSTIITSTPSATVPPKPSPTTSEPSLITTAAGVSSTST